MLRVEPSLFSNVITSVQRTGSLTGGAVRGLPGGAVVEGLKGINSFASEISEAQKEYQLGRVRSALERIKQIEAHFNGIAGRWNSTVGSLISSARQGKQKISLQKLNEVKNAQTKMQQLTGPATKAFQDLVSALEHAVSMEGRSDTDEENQRPDQASERETPEQEATETETSPGPSSDRDATTDETPDLDSLGSFGVNYRFGPKLQIRRGADGRTRVVPQLQSNQFYFLAGLEPPRVVRVRQIESKSILVFDTLHAAESQIPSVKVRVLLGKGIWSLVPKATKR